MPRFKPYSYEQLLMIPVDLKNQLQPGTFEFALNQVKEDEAIERLRGKVRKIEGWLEKGEDKKGRGGRVRQSNLTGNESAKMASALL
jgi:hypothetical protein